MKDEKIVDSHGKPIGVLRGSHMTDERILAEYIKAVNQIDDYFEYSHESEKDKAFVMAAIDTLNENILKAVEADREERK